MGALSKTLGLGGSMDSEGDESPESLEPAKPKGDGAELMAMRMFMKAETPERKLSAFKALMKACDSSGMPEDDYDF